LEYTSEGNIWRRVTKKKEYEEFFTPLESLGKSPFSSCDEITMLDLREHATSNFNLWSISANKIKK